MSGLAKLGREEGGPLCPEHCSWSVRDSASAPWRCPVRGCGSVAVQAGSSPEGPVDPPSIHGPATSSHRRPAAPEAEPPDAETTVADPPSLQEEIAGEDDEKGQNVCAGRSPRKSASLPSMTSIRALALLLLLGAAGGGIGVWAYTRQGTAREPRRTAAAAAQTAAAPSEPMRIGPGVNPPVEIASSAPVYPEAALRAGLEGTVVLEALVSMQGDVTSVRVLKGVHPSLDMQALATVKAFRYRPATFRGRPVSVFLRVEVRFGISR